MSGHNGFSEDHGGKCGGLSASLENDKDKTHNGEPSLL